MKKVYVVTKPTYQLLPGQQFKEVVDVEIYIFTNKKDAEKKRESLDCFTARIKESFIQEDYI